MIIKSIITGFVIVLVFGLLVFAQQMPSGATLRGRFIYEDTGLPLRRAWVGLKMIKSFRENDSNSNLDYNASYFASNTYASNGNYGEEGELVLTGDNGEYVLKDIEPGIYFPFVKQKGIFNPDKTEAENPYFRQITVVGNEEIELDFAVKRGGSIEGRVSYQDGSPALGLSVTFMQEGKNSIEDLTNEVVRTDDRGIYRFSGLGAGEYIVFASEPVIHTDQTVGRWDSEIEQNSRRSMLKVYYPAGYSVKGARPVNLQLGQEQKNIDIVVPDHPFAALSGMVISAADKRPIPGFTVSFSRKGDEDRLYDPDGLKQVITDENGRWYFRDLLPGRYLIDASRGRIGPGRFLKDDDAEPQSTKYASISKEIEIVEGINDNIVLELKTAATISGFIEYDGELESDAEYSYMHISAFDIEKATSSSTFASGRGTEGGRFEFELDDLSSGSFSLDVFSFNGAYVRSIYLNGRDVTGSAIEVSEGETIDGVRIVLATDFGTLDGNITNPFIGSRRYVRLIPVDFAEAQRYWGASDYPTPLGTFQLKAKPGRYYIVTREVEEPEDGATPEEIRLAWEELVKGAEIVELKPRETIKKTITLD